MTEANVLPDEIGRNSVSDHATATSDTADIIAFKHAKPLQAPWRMFGFGLHSLGISTFHSSKFHHKLQWQNASCI